MGTVHCAGSSPNDSLSVLESVEHDVVLVSDAFEVFRHERLSDVTAVPECPPQRLCLHLVTIAGLVEHVAANDINPVVTESIAAPGWSDAEPAG